MTDIHFKRIPNEEIDSILPLLSKLNTKTPSDLLRSRLHEMITQQYECVAMLHADKIIGICGLWYSTRHYIGKSAEVDHVIIDEKYRDKGLGRSFFKWIYSYLREKGCEAAELNTFVENRKSHKFYYNEGFEIFGFHMLKVLREDRQFY